MRPRGMGPTPHAPLAFGESVRIVGAVNAYQDAALLGACLESLRPVVDAIIVVDGRYRDFPSYGAEDEGGSVDGTLDVARAAGARIIPAPDGKPWPSEITKRNAYLNVLGAGDYVLVVDADERVEASGPLDRAVIASRLDWGVQHYREEQFTLNKARKHDDENARRLGSLWLHRMFAWREGIHYAGTHHIVHIGNHGWIDPRPFEFDETAHAPGVRLCHVTRTDYAREVRKERYYIQLRQSEVAWRVKHLGETPARTGASAF